MASFFLLSFYSIFKKDEFHLKVSQLWWIKTWSQCDLLSYKWVQKHTLFIYLHSFRLLYKTLRPRVHLVFVPDDGHVPCSGTCSCPPVGWWRRSSPWRSGHIRTVLLCQIGWCNTAADWRPVITVIRSHRDAFKRGFWPLHNSAASTPLCPEKLCWDVCTFCP